eukprot:scaffold68604_cov69-Phaeocystis_antarctica.AAC.2
MGLGLGTTTDSQAHGPARALRGALKSKVCDCFGAIGAKRRMEDLQGAWWRGGVHSLDVRRPCEGKAFPGRRF